MRSRFDIERDYYGDGHLCWALHVARIVNETIFMMLLPARCLLNGNEVERLLLGFEGQRPSWWRG